MKIPRAFVEYIENHCDINEKAGCLICKKCENRVIIDWFEYELTCCGCDDI